MKTILYTSCFLEGVDKSGSSRLERTVRWLHYYNAIRERIGFDQIFLTDNGSPKYQLHQLAMATVGIPWLLKTEERLVGNHDACDYPYSWRAVYKLKDFICPPDSTTEKIIVIDNDSFVVSERMASFIRNTNSGWVTLNCPMYNFPAAEIQIINKDVFKTVVDFTHGTEKEFIARHNGKMLENVLPFTEVNRDFVADRFGEIRARQTPEMDFYSQAPTDIRITYQLQPHR